MSYDELELDRMGDRRTATFFCISDTDSTYNFLVALAFSQMFNLLCERADNVHGGRLPHHVRVLWDEAANTGQVPNLEKLVAVIRSREISLCLLYQQLAQCKAIYDKNAETILGNMDSVLFLGGREASTIKEISENWLGKATISMQTEGRSRGQSESYSQNTQRLGRELMTPSELATMPGDRCILQLRGLPPFYSRKYDLKQHPNYRFTAEADKVKNAFDLNSLVTRRMDKLNPNETYTVYKVDVPDEALTGEDEDILNYQDMQPSYYDNQDGSLCFVCDQPDMYYFLYGEGWAHTQTEMLERGLTLRQYEEFARLQNGVLAQFTTQREILFAGQPFQAPESYLRNAELYEEGQTGNYNMLDGRLNNEPPVRPDLTDGQTDEEIRELVPEAKPSLMDRLKADKPEHEARQMIPPVPERER